MSHPFLRVSIVKSLLHVGCGRRGNQAPTGGFNPGIWHEIRVDIDPGVEPDVVANILDLSVIEAGSVDAVLSSHNIEHLFAHEVPVALGEFRRVLGDDGFLVIGCPDLQSVAALIAADRLTDTAYDSPAGPITPLDILYGFRPALRDGQHYMAHRCGFTERVLNASLIHAGFAQIRSLRNRPGSLDLWAIASCSNRSDAQMHELAASHLPTFHASPPRLSDSPKGTPPA